MRALCAVVLVWSSVAGAVTKEIAPGANLPNEVAALMPGDELVLAGGTYTVDVFWNVTVSGTAAMPIVIRSKTGETAHITRSNANQNLVNITGSYLVFKDLEFSGGSAGLRFQTGSSFITLEGCHIHHTDDVAIRANDTGGTYDGFKILKNQVDHTGGTGEAMYLGCNSAGCRFANALIAGNWVHDTNGATVSQGDGIEIKEGSYGNVVRDNVIHDTGYPCITLYSAGTNASMKNVIERNVMWHCGDHGIQISRDGVVQNNIVLSAVSDGISLQPHAQVTTGGPGNLTVVNNTVVDVDGAALAVRNATGPVLIANNALYASTGVGLNVVGASTTLTLRNNVGSGGGMMLGTGTLASDFVSATFGGAPPNDVFPKMGGALVGTANFADAPADDFNGTARTMPTDVGAYQFASGGNPGWVIAAGFKSVGAGGGGATGGGGGATGGGGSATGGGTATGGGSSTGGGAATGGGGGATGGGATSDAGTGGGGGTAGAGCTCSTGVDWAGVLGMLLAFAARSRRR